MSPARFEDVAAEVWVPLQRYLRRRTDAATADDVLGDVLLVMWRRRLDIPEDAALPWCYGVARGCLGNARRGDDRRLRLVQRIAAESVAADSADPDLDAALARLPDRDRELLRLWAWEGLAPREIAVVLGITPNAASIRLHRAKDALRKDLATSGHKGSRQGEEAPA
ncbi:MAG: sigma-70 family RNA polymerase sigma factor [Mycobacteriales bacterium]|nr:sigma-70 family RNA polymerase sigma factor [Mycobacteriales bacterium]